MHTATADGEQGLSADGLEPFLTFPHEWTFSRLRDAALQELDAVLAAPDAPWTGYRQFCQSFLYPLLLQSYRNVPFQPYLRKSQHGIDAKQMRSLLGTNHLLQPGVLTHVLLQGVTHKLPNHQAVARLRRLVQRLSWRSGRSPRLHQYSPEDGTEKRRFVEQCLRRKHWSLAWNVGCGAAEYAMAAARHADFVLALDTDPGCVERLYLDKSSPNVMPLMLDFESAMSLRQRRKPDIVLCLDFLHHVLLDGSLELRDFVAWLAAANVAVLEFPTPQDAAVMRKLEARSQDFSVGGLERALSKVFNIEKRLVLPSQTRILYQLARIQG